MGAIIQSAVNSHFDRLPYVSSHRNRSAHRRVWINPSCYSVIDSPLPVEHSRAICHLIRRNVIYSIGQCRGCLIAAGRRGWVAQLGKALIGTPYPRGEEENPPFLAKCSTLSPALFLAAR